MSRSNATPLYEAHELVKRFGAFVALDRLSLSVRKGEVVGLAGPNGSGKTTAINAISGLFAADGGSQQLMGNRIDTMPAYRRVKQGINRTFQVPRNVGALTVFDNVTLAAHYGRRAQHDTLHYIRRVGLGEFVDREAGLLNTSEQKRLDLARALATEPQLLLIDELGAGLTPAELEEMGSLISDLAGEGRGIVVVEHLMDFLQRITDRVYILDAGKPIFEGTVERAAQDETVIEVFLGQ